MDELINRAEALIIRLEKTISFEPAIIDWQAKHDQASLVLGLYFSDNRKNISTT